VSDVYHNPKTGEVWADGKTYPNAAAYQAASGAASSGPQQTSVPNLKDTSPAGPGMAALHTAGNSLAFGLPDQIMARHLADKYQIPLDQAFGLIKQHFAGGEQAMGPDTNRGLEMAAMAPSFALAPEVKGAQGLIAAMHGVGHTESQDPVELAKNALMAGGTAEAGGAVAQAIPAAAKRVAQVPGDVASAVLERFPRLRDYFARNLVPQAQNPSTVKAMLGQPAGTYANQVTGEGLQKPWFQSGRLETAKANMAKAGPKYEELLGDKTVPVEAVTQALTPEGTAGLVDAPARLKSELGDLTSKATRRSPDMQAKYDLLQRARELRASQGLPPNAANEAALAQMGPGDKVIPAQRVNDRIAKINDLLRKAYTEGGASGDIQAYHAAKTDLQDALGRAGVDVNALKQVNRSYAINEEAGMQLQGREMTAGSNPPGNRYGIVRKTVQALERPAARSALDAYAKRHNNPAATLPPAMKAAAKANPAVSAALTEAVKTGDPLDAAVELHKAQAEQPVREAINPGAP